MSFHGGVAGCAFAVVLFAWRRHISTLSLGDVTCAVAPIGLFLGRIANFINGELWGRPTDVPWAMIFPHGGPIPRHPSQLYEASLEGVVLFVVLDLLVRFGALKRPGVVTAAFFIGYGLARSFCEFFREPDVQLGFLWSSGWLTMGMLLVRALDPHRPHPSRDCPAAQAGRRRQADERRAGRQKWLSRARRSMPKSAV